MILFAKVALAQQFLDYERKSKFNSFLVDTWTSISKRFIYTKCQKKLHTFTFEPFYYFQNKVITKMFA